MHERQNQLAGFGGFHRITSSFVELQEKNPYHSNTHDRFWIYRGSETMSLQIETEKIGTTLVVRLAGELDHHTAELVRDRVERELDNGVCKNMIFSFEHLDFMDSSGLGVILGRYKRISQLGGKMSLCAVSDSLRKLLELSGILKILPVYDTETRALAEMGEA